MARISKNAGKLIPHRDEWSEGMLTNKDRKIAEQLKKRLLASDGTRIQRVLLYGSRAKGTATKESDFDLLVVAKGKRGQAGFFSFAKDPDDTNEEQLRHEESFHDERT
jgi:predicted nucleotidyltransferase